MAGGNMMQMHSRMMRYDTVVKRLNEYRLEGYSFGLVHAFLDAVKGMGQDPVSATHAVCMPDR